MKAGLDKRIEKLEEKTSRPDTEMDVIARIKHYEQIFEDNEINPEIEKYIDVLESEEQVQSNPQPVEAEEIQEEGRKMPTEPLSQPEMVSEQPDNLIKGSGPFRKEWTRDSQGNWFWQTTVDLSDVDLDPPRDPEWEAAFKAALDSC